MHESDTVTNKQDWNSTLATFPDKPIKSIYHVLRRRRSSGPSFGPKAVLGGGGGGGKRDHSSRGA